MPKTKGIMTVEEENFRLGVSYMLHKYDKVMLDSQNAAEFMKKLIMEYEDERKVLNER